MKETVSKILIIGLILVTFLLCLAQQGETLQIEDTTKESLLRHDESLRIVKLLDQILSKLKEELNGRTQEEQENQQKIQQELASTRDYKSELNEKLAKAEEKIRYLEELDQAAGSHAEELGRNREQVQKEIDLVKKIKKILVGTQHLATCESNTDCEDGMACDNGACRVQEGDSCQSSYECVAGSNCYYGRCRSVLDTQCTVDNDCSERTVCYDGQCKLAVGQSCAEDNQCHTSICEERRCKTSFKSLCSASIDCEGSLICSDNHCVYGMEEKCNTHMDCASGYCGRTPSSEETVCMNNPCADVSCANGNLCDITGTCKVPAGEYCANSTMCGYGLECSQEKCRAPVLYECESTDQCLGGICHGVCKQPVGTHSSCSSDDECISHYCNNGFCDTVQPYDIFENKRSDGPLLGNNTEFASSGTIYSHTSNSREIWYWEVECLRSTGCDKIDMGISSDNKNYYYRPNAAQFVSNQVTKYEYGTNSKFEHLGVISVHADFENLRLGFSVNGEFLGWNQISEDDYRVTVQHRSSDSHIRLNFGQESFKYAPELSNSNQGWFGGHLFSSCAQPYECSGDLSCSNGKCRAPLASKCDSDSLCSRGNCRKGRCSLDIDEQCIENEQCATGLCQNERCALGQYSIIDSSTKHSINVREKGILLDGHSDDMCAMADVAHEQGKWFFEAECVGNCGEAVVGIASDCGNYGASGRYIGWRPDVTRIESSFGRIYFHKHHRINNGDFIGVLVDLDNRKCGFYLNNTFVGWSREIPVGYYRPAVWGDDHSLAINMRMNFGQFKFNVNLPADVHRGWYGGTLTSSCNSRIDCQGSLECEENRCVYPLNSRCESHHQCSTEHCSDGRCVRSAGEYCQFDNECATGSCKRGRCYTGHYAVLNSQLSNSSPFEAFNTEVTLTSSESVFGNIGNTVGKWYFEIECIAKENCDNVKFGVEYNSNKYDSNNIVNSFSRKDVLGIMVDLELGKVGFRKNDGIVIWAHKDIPLDAMYRPVFHKSGGSNAKIRVNFGYYPFKEMVPDGFEPGWFGGKLRSSCGGSVSSVGTDFSCESPNVCYEGSCLRPSSEMCSQNNECITDLCHDHKCVRLAGEFCNSDDDCLTGMCRDSICSVGNYSHWDVETPHNRYTVKDKALTEVYTSYTRNDRLLAVYGKRSGKWYFEVEYLNSECRSMTLGLATHHDQSSGKMIGFRAYRREMWYSKHNHRHYGQSVRDKNAVIGVRVDLDNNRIGYLDGENSWMGWYDLEELSDSELWYPALVESDDRYNEYNDHSELRANFGYYPFHYSIPEGYHHGWYK
eukprot:gb/GECH01011206.1/.p1 GENE.gb/GECH01011206.1/~~gb/GECH01011206.1/.p1  ORF type:complete len:1297 (+),score=210.57 gb/GECH01011206.1/:1-3891(+)